VTAGAATRQIRHRLQSRPQDALQLRQTSCRASFCWLELPAVTVPSATPASIAPESQVESARMPSSRDTMSGGLSFEDTDRSDFAVKSARRHAAAAGGDCEPRTHPRSREIAYSRARFSAVCGMPKWSKAIYRLRALTARCRRRAWSRIARLPTQIGGVVLDVAHALNADHQHHMAAPVCTSLRHR